MIMFSPLRVLAVVLLVVLTMLYANRMQHNATPHGADRTRQEQPLYTSLP